MEEELKIIMNIHLQYKKVSCSIEQNYKKVISIEFNKNEWIKQGKRITQDIITFEKLNKDLSQRINNFRKNYFREKEDNIELIENCLEEGKRKIIPKISEIKERTKGYYEDFEMKSEEELPQRPEIIVDLMNNKMILEQRRKELEDINQTFLNMKEISEMIKEEKKKQIKIQDQINTINKINSIEKEKKENKVIKEKEKNKYRKEEFKEKEMSEIEKKEIEHSNKIIEQYETNKNCFII